MSILYNKILYLEQKIILETSKQATLLTEQEVKEFFLHALKSEPKQLIDYLIKEIIVYEDKVETGITKTIEMQIKMRI